LLGWNEQLDIIEYSYKIELFGSYESCSNNPQTAISVSEKLSIFSNTTRYHPLSSREESEVEPWYARHKSQLE
jgi:hypothetical protein